MKFKNFKVLLKSQFEEMIENEDYLFTVDVDRDKMWELYLESFPAEYNRIFRERREHDCSCCRSFIKNFGNVVVIKDNKVVSLWDFEIDDTEFTPSVDALKKYIHKNTINNVYVNKFNKIGTDSNLEKLDNGKILEWEHLYMELPAKFVNKSSKSIGEIQGEYNSSKGVFKRSLDELTQDSILTVLELIQQGSLYKGDEWRGILTEFLKLKKEYDKLDAESKNNYAWKISVSVGGAISRIRNHSIGTLLVNISENMDLDEAVRKYEVIVAPSNYKRPKAIFTKRMLEDAKRTIEELGFLDSLNRRYARLDDITVNNILFSNKDSAKKMWGTLDIFEEMAGELPVNPKKFSKVEEISIDDFVTNILPNSSELELYLENKHSSNMVSLIAPENKDSKTMFKWDNNFSWAYSGNITDSMKERVKSAGGKVDGVLRFSIQWNDVEDDRNDLDAHCVEPNGNRIFFSRSRNHETTGELDIDIRYPSANTPAVENITWSNKSRMLEGNYNFIVHNYSHNGGRSGFRAEIEFDGQTYSFEYNKELRQGEYVEVADVFLRDGKFTIKEKLPSNLSCKDVWNLQTNNFIPISVVMYSPNYWNEQEGIGHRHYFFMLKDCTNSEQPNGFYNEFLKEDLMKHKRVFEALGSKMRVKEVDDQLSGIGFSSTKRNEVLIKVKGQTERVIKVKI